MKRFGGLSTSFLVALLVLSTALFMVKKGTSPSTGFGESCFDRATDDYLIGVCEKISLQRERDLCYYDEAISEGYVRICHLIENASLKRECAAHVNITLSNNETLKARAERFNPCNS